MTLWHHILGVSRVPPRYQSRPRSQPVMTAVAGCLIFPNPWQLATAVQSRSSRDCRSPPVTATGLGNSICPSWLSLKIGEIQGVYPLWLSLVFQHCLCRSPPSPSRHKIQHLRLCRIGSGRRFCAIGESSMCPRIFSWTLCLPVHARLLLIPWIQLENMNVICPYVYSFTHNHSFLITTHDRKSEDAMKCVVCCE